MTKIVEDQYQALGEIKEFDERIARLQISIDQIPRELHSLQAEFDEKHAEFEEQKGKIEQGKKNLKNAEFELREREEKILKAQEKMMEVKTNEAYTAALTEIEAQNKEKAKLEDEILGYMTDLESESATFRETEEQFKRIAQTTIQSKKELEEEEKKLRSEQKELQEKKQFIVAKLDTNTASLHSRVSTRVVGSTVVEMSDGKCMGCRIKIRQQLYNEILGGVRVEQCPNCGRILIPWKDTSEKSTDAAAK